MRLSKMSLQPLQKNLHKVSSPRKADDYLKIQHLPSDLNISLPASQAIFAVTQKTRTDAPLTQSAASMLKVATKFATGCAPVDKLLGGGLSRGQLVEISGPPGTPKEQLATSLARSFVEAGEEVLFVGMRSILYSNTVSQVLYFLSSQRPKI